MTRGFFREPLVFFFVFNGLVSADRKLNRLMNDAHFQLRGTDVDFRQLFCVEWSKLT